MRKYLLIGAAILIMGGFVAYKYFPSNTISTSKQFPVGLETQVFAKVDEKTRGQWDKKLTVERVHISEKAVEGKWVAKDYWDWIAWQQGDGSWRVLVSLDGFDCYELRDVPFTYSSFFYGVTYDQNTDQPYCYSHADRER